MKTTGYVRVYNRYRVFSEIASYTTKTIHYLSIIFRLLGVHYILFIFVCVF